MPVKSRYPDRDFSHRPYLLWLQRVYAWLLTQVGESDYPSHEVGDLPPLIAALESALNNWESLHGIATDRSKFYTDASDALRKQLQLLKQIIPTVIDPHVMGSFGLDKSLPDSRDELGGVAEICIMHWNEVIGGGVPVEYQPLEPQFNALITLYGDFETLRTNYYDSYNIAQQAQDDVIAAREACHAKERDIFNWYNGFHPDSEAEWWTSTEWGTSSGGSGGGEEPEWPDWPGPVEASAEQIDEGLVRITYSGLNGGKTLRIDRLKQGDADYVLVTQGLPLDDPEEVMPFDDNHLDKKKYTYKLTPFDEVGNPGTPALVEVTVS